MEELPDHIPVPLYARPSALWNQAQLHMGLNPVRETHFFDLEDGRVVVLKPYRSHEGPEERRDRWQAWIAPSRERTGLDDPHECYATAESAFAALVILLDKRQGRT